ncbi:hypothetical protein [Virgisporangium aurantiacum]|uniref:Uncharacterized protein n=1 Tax=Virgisporangium aurantiacum TaxID=175570 RepID=A0A8J3ZNS5_9ACTN|nr:hypothetical protein [Virgisporangium aurantiacum]GIJ64926.1 hypothetical protein Vau01_124420 [Virgisporangium aurantiacum]
MADELDVWRRALAADDPVEDLRAAAQDRLAAGESRDRVIEQLTQLVLELRQEQRPDEDEDPVLDVLDMLTGWCAPGSAI